MNNLEMFYQQNVKEVINAKIKVSDRFKDKDGKIIEWEIRTLTNKEDDLLRKKHTTYKKSKKGIATPTLDSQAYIMNTVLDCVVFPDLRDTKLCETWGVVDPADLVNKMLLPGEYNTLVSEIQTLNGWDIDINELVDEVKN